MVFLLPPEAFCGLKYAENAISAGALPQTPQEELTMLPQTLWSAEERTPPHTPAHSAPLAPRCLRLRHLDHHALLTPNPGDATGHHHFLK